MPIPSGEDYSSKLSADYKDHSFVDKSDVKKETSWSKLAEKHFKGMSKTTKCSEKLHDRLARAGKKIPTSATQTVFSNVFHK